MPLHDPSSGDLYSDTRDYSATIRSRDHMHRTLSGDPSMASLGSWSRDLSGSRSMQSRSSSNDFLSRDLSHVDLSREDVRRRPSDAEMQYAASLHESSHVEHTDVSHVQYGASLHDDVHSAPTPTEPPPPYAA